jgi:23S rRNA (pseudouridine1915-N3)-methyltransferase
MKLECLFVGKTSDKNLADLIDVYLKRLKHYVPVSITIIASPAATGNAEQVMKKESELMLKKINSKDFVILLDERGKEMSSVQFADFLNKSMINGIQKVVFIIGGAYGVPDNLVQRSNLVLSFSKFTLTHQMIRIFLIEQIYRAMTIIRNEPYHHS